MQFRKGDTVSMRGTIRYDVDQSEDRVFVRVDGSTEDLWVSPKILTLIQSKFELGDRVCWAADGMGEIIGISGGHAWIDMQDGNYCTRHFGAITLMDEPIVLTSEEIAASEP